MQRSLDDSQMTAINAYLDGLMSPEEVQAFEGQLAQDETLRAHLDWQRSIQQRLKSSLDFDQLRNAIEKKIEPPTSRPILRMRMLIYAGMAAAAAVVLSFVLSELNERAMTSMSSRYEIVVRPPAEVYDALVASGFQPAEVCTVEQIPGWTEEKLGVRLAVANVPNEVTLLGWSYGYDLSGRLLGDYAGVLLTRVAEQEVLVVMDKLANDRDLVTTGREDLFIYRRELGDLVFYELTPLSEARVIPLFELSPAEPAPPTPDSIP